MRKNQFRISIKTGQVFNRLTVISEAITVRRKRYVFCRCECGSIKSVDVYCLHHGTTQSCGCLGIERRNVITSARSKTHGESHSCGITAEYRSWLKMKERCYSAKSNRFHLYGGRGISVCEAWKNSFEQFLSDMGRRPTPEHSIDRIDVDGNYEPSNCKWSTDKEQARNRHNTIFVTVDGVTKPLRQWCEELNLPATTVTSRIQKGWPIDDKLLAPTNIKYRNKACRSLAK